MSYKSLGQKFFREGKDNRLDARACACAAGRQAGRQAGAEEEDGSVGRKNFRRFQHAKVELSHYFTFPPLLPLHPALLGEQEDNGLIDMCRKQGCSSFIYPSVG